MRRHLRASLVAVTLAGLLSVVQPGASAQEATPVVPGVDDCTVEPRSEEEILAIVEAAPTPTTDERDEERRLEWADVTIVGPADFETQQAIRATVYELFACANADMPLSQFALYTEDAIVSYSPTVEELRGQDPSAEIVDGEVVEQDPGTVLDVLYVQQLSNGQVAAVAVFADLTELPFDAMTIYFELVDGRWLLDIP